METPNLERLKAAYASWAQPWASAAEVWLALCDDRVCVGSLGAATGGRLMSGKMAVAQYLAQLAADWEMLTYDMGEFVADGDRIVVIGRVVARNRATGKLLDTPKIDVFRFEDGRIVEFFEHLDTAAEMAARG